MSGPAADPVLHEVLDALEMPRAGLRNWIQKSIRCYCDDHGGRTYYGDLMDLYGELLSAAGEAPGAP